MKKAMRAMGIEVCFFSIFYNIAYAFDILQKICINFIKLLGCCKCLYTFKIIWRQTF